MPINAQYLISGLARRHLKSRSHDSRDKTKLGYSEYAELRDWFASAETKAATDLKIYGIIYDGRKI